MVTSASKGGVGVPLEKNKSEIEAECGKINVVFGIWYFCDSDTTPRSRCAEEIFRGTILLITS